MALVVVATFMSLTEAQIAASALESGGLHPMVMDQGWGSVIWTQQCVLQGFRLAVPEQEATDAIAHFKHLPKPRRRPRRPSRTTLEFVAAHWWRAAAVLFWLGLSPTLGWLAVGFRPRRGPHTQTLNLMVAMGIVTVAVALILTGFVLLLRLTDVFAPAVVVLPLVVAVAMVVIEDHRKRSDRG